VPPPSQVGKYKLPYVLVGDEGYPLLPYLMRPYPRSSQLDLKKKVYNYRHSRVRRTVESAFGIAVARWRILRRAINTSVTKAEKIVLAVICLHNFIIQEELLKRPQERRYLQLNELDKQHVLVGIRNFSSKQMNSKQICNSVIVYIFVITLIMKMLWNGNGKKLKTMNFDVH